MDKLGVPFVVFDRHARNYYTRIEIIYIFFRADVVKKKTGGRGEKTEIKKINAVVVARYCYRPRLRGRCADLCPTKTDKRPSSYKKKN